MILDDIQTQRIGDFLIGYYILHSNIQWIFLMIGGIFLFSGGDFEIISNNMKTMSNILILIFCILLINFFKWISLCFTKNIHIIYAIELIICLFYTLIGTLGVVEFYSPEF